MTLKKIKTLSDVCLYVNETPIPGVISFNETTSDNVYGIRVFGESRPAVNIEQNTEYTVRLSILDFDGLDGLFGESGFNLRISDGHGDITYTGCAVEELSRSNDKDNRIVTVLNIKAKNKTKDVI